MPLKFFWISAKHGENETEELNKFLRSHRVLEVERRWIERDEQSAWAVCVDDIEKTGGVGSGKGEFVRSGVDYREVLKPEEFEVFRRLRDWRKAKAAEDQMPAYAIFKDDQLADIVRSKATSKSGLEKLPGIGPAKAEKYGEAVIKILREKPEFVPSTISYGSEAYATSGRPV